MQHKHVGSPSYEETSFGSERTPLLQDLEARLYKLRRNSFTGILDISDLSPEIKKPLSMEEKKRTDRKGKTVYQKSVPQGRLFKTGAVQIF